ncbi:MAG: DUF3997 domain-containing protein [Mariniphaga sp.]|nr:DUF3997 domain-containing protein [Mariniphaga sp.]
MRNWIMILFVVFSLLSCSDFVIKKNIVGNYYLIATDTEDDLGLAYHEPEDGQNYATIVDATVFTIGFNDKFINVKQHPRTFPNPPDLNITNYYILPLKKGMDWKIKNGLIGPLTLDEFNEKRKELNIANDIKFINVADL